MKNFFFGLFVFTLPFVIFSGVSVYNLTGPLNCTVLANIFAQKRTGPVNRNAQLKKVIND